jgi:hypothetical protein
MQDFEHSMPSFYSRWIGVNDWIWIIVELSLWRLWDGLSGGFVDGRLALAEDFIEEDGFLGGLPR